MIENPELNSEEELARSYSPNHSDCVGGHVLDKAKKSIMGNADENISRALRSVKTDNMRKTSRHQRLSILRGIENIEKPMKPVQEITSKIASSLIKKPTSREEQLKKWKEEKILKKQLESKSKRPPFIVGGVKSGSEPPAISLTNSHISKDSFISKIPRAFPVKASRVLEVSMLPKGSSVKPVSKPDRTFNTAVKTLIGSSRKTPSTLKNPVKPAISKSTSKVNVFKPNFAPAKPTAVNSKVKSLATKNVVKPGTCKNNLKESSVSRRSFAPPNFVFSPSCFESICDRFEEVVKTLQTSTPVKSSKKSVRGLDIWSEKANLLHKKSAVFSVGVNSNVKKAREDTVTSSSNTDKVNEHNEFRISNVSQNRKLANLNESCTNKNSPIVDSEAEAKVNIDAKNEQSLHTPRRSMRLQHKINEEIVPSDQGSIAQNFKKDSETDCCNAEKRESLHTPRRSTRLQFKDNYKECNADEISVDASKKDVEPNTPEIKKGVTLRSPRRSRRLHHKTDEKELDATKTPVVDSPKEIKSKKSQVEKLMSFYTPHRAIRHEFSTICEESELSIVENSPAVGIKAAPISVSQRTRLTEEFEKLSLQTLLDYIPEIEDQDTFVQLNKDFRPSLLYTPICNSKRSVINVKGDMIQFSPDT